MTDGDDLSGSDLGDFRLDRCLGAGAMGVVYAATERTLNRVVAVKVLPLDGTRDPITRARFLREARAAAAIAHPNVAAIHQAGSVGERVFIAMELVPGATLRAYLEAGRLPLAEALRITREVALGLAAAHAAGVVHRDIKPDNIMLTPDGAVKVLDFGVARFFDVNPITGPPADPASLLTAAGQLVGTPGYMAPEQARSLPVDGRADLFSLGIVLYEMLTGHRPFSGATPYDVVIAITRDPPAPVTLHRADLPPGVVNILERCLAKDPAARFQDGIALADALDKVAGSARRRGLRLGLGIAGVGAIIAAGVAVLALTSPAPAPTLASPIAGAPAPAIAPSPSAQSPTPTPAPVPGLTADAGVLACPILEASGTEGHGGWLGAGAAHMACERATLLLGGMSSRTLVPAELLDLPRELTHDFPPDPFVAPDARARTLAAARARAVAWLDGSIVASDDGFTLELRLESASTTTPARAVGHGRSLDQAIRQAQTQLIAAGALPRAGALAPDAAWFTGIADGEAALAHFDWETTLPTDAGIAAELAALAPFSARLGARWPLAQWQSFLMDDETPRPADLEATLRALPAATPRDRMWKAQARALAEPGCDLQALALELAGLRAATEAHGEKLALAQAEATIRYRAGETEAARLLVLSVAAADPRRVDWVLLGDTVNGTPITGPFVRTKTAWLPSSPESWFMRVADPGIDFATQMLMVRRAMLLAPAFGYWSRHQATAHIWENEPAKAEAIAARLARGDSGDVATAEVIRAQIDLAQARFGSARTRARAALATSGLYARIESPEYALVEVLVAISHLYGEQHAVADDFAERFVLSDPPRLMPGAQTVTWTAGSCQWASPPTAARCFERLDRLLRSGWFIEGRVPGVDAFRLGAARFAAGDHAGAVAAWRPGLADGNPANGMERALEAAGEVELASQLDRKWIETWGSYLHGAGMSHVREARRAFARKDYERFRALAKTIIDAWDGADVPVPLVAEMRARLSELPAVSTPVVPR